MGCYSPQATLLFGFDGRQEATVVLYFARGFAAPRVPGVELCEHATQRIALRCCMGLWGRLGGRP